MNEQLTIEGFGGERLFYQAQKYLEKNGPEKTIKFLEEKDFHWLTDFNSGVLLAGKVGPYVPYRILFPGDRILDEREIYNEISELEGQGFSEDSILVARILEECVNAEETNKDLYKFCNYSFISEEDEKETLKKYSEKAFYSK